MTREALKLALEALEEWLPTVLVLIEKKKSAITAIKEALAQPEHGWTPERIAGMARLKEAQDKKLAQPEQDGKCKYCTDGCLACDARKLPEQERFLVATIGNWGRVEWADGVFPSLGDKMYSAPRTWVGLTDDEVKQLCLAAGTEPIEVRLIEAKLKEKNT